MMQTLMIAALVLAALFAIGGIVGNVLRKRAYTETKPYKYPGQGGVDMGEDDDDRVRRVD